MKIRITDTAWGINRMNGESSERVVATEEFRAALGTLTVGPARHTFEITAVNDSSVELVLNARGDRVTVRRGTSHTYRPWSFDGGHYYKIEVI